MMRTYGMIQYYREKQKQLAINELKKGFENDKEIYFR